MKSTTAFTRKDIVVVMGCVVFLLVNLGAIGSGGRRRAKRLVCLTNLRQLTLAWTQYANDNDGKLVNGDTGEYDIIHPDETPWVLRDWGTDDMEVKRNAILNGALFPYCKDIKLYKCPMGVREETRSYSVVDAMNCKGWSGMGAVMIKKRAKIHRPGERCVFIDAGGIGPALMGGWTCYTRWASGGDSWRWWDPPPIRHDDGTTFSFADGHSEYWKWEDQRTVEWGRRMLSFSDPQLGNPDIRRCQVAAWGSEVGN